MKRHILTTTLLFAGTIAATAITYQEWKALKFTSAEQYELSISGQAADPDKDGRANLMEYALDTDPKTYDESSPVNVELDQEGHLTLDYPRRKSHTGFLYIPQVSGNLLTGWQTGAQYLETTGIIDMDADHELVSIRDPLFVGQASKRFIRLLVDNDMDGDGLPDTWELRNGLSPIDPSDGSGDLDGDGRTNLEEFLDGTNALLSDTPPPTNAPPPPPTNVEAVEYEDGSLHVWWTDGSDNETYFVIRKQLPDGTFVELGRVGPGQTHFYLPPQ